MPASVERRASRQTFIAGALHGSGPDPADASLRATNIIRQFLRLRRHRERLASSTARDLDAQFTPGSTPDLVQHIVPVPNVHSVDRHDAVAALKTRSLRGTASHNGVNDRWHDTATIVCEHTGRDHNRENGVHGHTCKQDEHARPRWLRLKPAIGRDRFGSVRRHGLAIPICRLLRTGLHFLVSALERRCCLVET